MRVKWRDFELPNTVRAEEESRTDKYAKFMIEPFEVGFGVTIGNSLRRVLLSWLEGASLYAVKIEGVSHEFAGIPGVYEDISDIVLRLKDVCLRIHEGNEAVLNIKRNKAGEIKAGDIQCPANAEILSPDLTIATLTEDVDFVAELWAKKGRGYVTAEELSGNKDTPGVIYLDAAFAPVSRVRYHTEATRVIQKINYDRLILEIWTNGVVTPEMALIEAAKILRKHLNPFVKAASLGYLQQPRTTESVEGEKKGSLGEADKELLDKLNAPISDLNLTVRARNCLEAKGINLVGHLAAMSEPEVLKVENLGRTSLQEVKRRLEEWGLHLGMEVPESFGKVGV